MNCTRYIRFKFSLAISFVAFLNVAHSESVAVRHSEGSLHGFLALTTLDGKNVATGDLLQSVDGDRVNCRLVFHFNDGSLRDETVIFSQHEQFKLVSYRLIQKGPTFKIPTDFTVNADSNRMTTRYMEDGKEKVATDKDDVPSDVANGMTQILLKNILHNTKLTTVSMAAATPKPRMVKLEISPEADDTVTVGNSKRIAQRYRVKVKIGGMEGLFAPLVGKLPPDTHVWILGGEHPAFLKSEGPLFLGGPIWRIELVNPVMK